jgi:hypothetical protein
MKRGENEMIAQETLQQLKHAPLADRIQVIEALLESLKYDIAQAASPQKPYETFLVRTFDFGSDISIDREEMYAERGL